MLAYSLAMSQLLGRFCCIGVGGLRGAQYHYASVGGILDTIYNANKIVHLCTPFYEGTELDGYLE
jgi:hypothetical protein